MMRRSFTCVLAALVALFFRRCFGAGRPGTQVHD
jgi:hypothetical protein